MERSWGRSGQEGAGGVNPPAWIHGELGVTQCSPPHLASAPLRGGSGQEGAVGLHSPAGGVLTPVGRGPRPAPALPAAPAGPSPRAPFPSCPRFGFFPVFQQRCSQALHRDFCKSSSGSGEADVLWLWVLTSPRGWVWCEPPQRTPHIPQTPAPLQSSHRARSQRKSPQRAQFRAGAGGRGRPSSGAGDGGSAGTAPPGPGWGWAGNTPKALTPPAHRGHGGHIACPQR